MARDYNAPQFGVRDTRTVQGGQVAQGDTRPKADIMAGDDMWMDKLVANLASGASATLNKMADVAFQSEYLDGAAQAGVAASEEELQGNPLTRDWKVAGYRDTMGKLALADNEAQVAADMPLLREKSPEEFKKYLKERRDKLLPSVQGMSREARVTMAGQMLLQDRTATKNWTTEHTKFIIDQKSQAVHAQWNTALKGLSAATMKNATGEINAADYQQALESTAGTVVGSVWLDNTLPLSVKQQLTSQMTQVALAQDNVALYDYLNQAAMPDGKGGGSTLISRLPGEEQLKLSTQYRESMSRTSDMRNLARTAQLSQLDAQLDANLYTGTYKELDDMLSPMVINRSITGERRGALLNKYLDKQYKNETNSQLADAVLRGDVAFIYGKDKGLPDAINALESTLSRRNVSPGQRLATWLEVGNNGVDEGFKKAGEMLGVSVRQMVTSTGEVLPQHAETFKAINTALRMAESKGLTNTRVRMLSGMGEEDRLFTEQVLRRVDTGASLDEAVQRSKEQQAQDTGLSPAIRAARAQTTAKALSTAVDAIEPRGMLSSVWTWTKAAVGSQAAAADLVLRPKSGFNTADHFFGDSPTVQWYSEQVRNAVRQEADNTLMLRPSATADEILSVAKANVAARTISTANGPLIMPRNVNLQTTFGVGPGNQAAIGTALDGMLKGTVDNTRFQLAFDQGRLFAQEFDKDGKRVGNGMFIDAPSIRAKIAEDTLKEAERANAVFGSGSVHSKDGLEVKYNGDNTAGVPGIWMHGFRDNLVLHEGVRSKAYQDLSGAKDKAGNDIMTVGVGVSSHNPHFPKTDKEGNVTSEDATKSFLGASNDAALAGRNAAKTLGRYNQAGFQLLSELAYQSGTAFMTQENKTGDRYRTFTEALQGKDVKTAQEAFKGTAAWYYSRNPKDPNKTTPRQRSYLSLIEQSMRG